MKISELKKDAKMKLSGKWGLAVGINLVHLIITLVLSYVVSKIEGIVGAILTLAVSIILIPLSYGLTASMLKLSRNENVGIADFITIGLQNFKKAFFLSLSIFVRILVPFLLITFAGVLSIVTNFADNINSTSSGSGIASIVPLLLSVGAIIWLIYKILSYALATYLLIDNPESNSKEVIKRSCELMKGNKLKFVGLVFSFFGWFLLCGFLSGIIESINVTLGTIAIYGTSLLLTPYITFAEINFYEDVAAVTKESNPIEGEITNSTIE